MSELIELYVEKVGATYFGVAHQNKNVVGLASEGTEDAALKMLLKILPYNVAFEVVPKGSVFTQQVFSTIKDIYDGKGLTRDISLFFNYLSDYTSRVLKVVFQIPVGYVSSYGLVANAVGGGPRAVGNVMANNPLAPIVPCHRVVTSDYGLGGYGGGLAMKFKILKLERRGFIEEKEIRFNDKSLRVFPIEFVFSHLEKISFPFHNKSLR